ncbi:MAG: RHS repeat-associated core domain-containing protein [Moheibacter sp.]
MPGDPPINIYSIFYFHSDHLGSSTILTEASGYAYQLFLNLPFGETMAEQRRSGTFNNVYKFNGKELDVNTGLYYYGARYYNPRVSNWLSVDPLAEKYPSISPYAFVANNPIIFVDPDGRQIEPGSQKEWDKQKNAVISERDRLQGKIDGLNTKASEKGWSAEKLSRKMGNMGDRVSNLNGTLTTLGTLESSDQVYQLDKISGAVGGITLDTKSNNIVISFNSTSNFVHETTHAGQFETGDLAFNTTTGLSLAQDLNDEVSAYKAQYSFDPSSTGGKNLNTINANWVKTLTDSSTGGLLYSGHGIQSININSTTSDMLKAYPNNTQLKNQINALTPKQRTRELQFKLKDYPSVYYKK